MPASFPLRPRGFITGAAGGFGRAVALDLAARGGRLALGDIDEVGLAETARLVESKGGEARTLACDVRDADQVEALAALADDAFGGIDIAVNNAGVAVAGPVGDVSLEDWKWQIDINLWGVIYSCHSVVPRMKRQGSGWILNVASLAGIASAPTMAPYNVTKAGVISLSETLAGELHGTDVHVSALCPSFFRTNIHEAARTSMPEIKAQTSKLVTEAKWSAEEIAEIALAGLERGQLYILPQPDAKGLWRVKRLLGNRFYGMLGSVMSSRRFSKYFGND